MPRTRIPVSMACVPFRAALFFSSWMTRMPKSNITVAINCRSRKGETGQEREQWRQEGPTQRFSRLKEQVGFMAWSSQGGPLCYSCCIGDAEEKTNSFPRKKCLHFIKKNALGLIRASQNCHLPPPFNLRAKVILSTFCPTDRAITICLQDISDPP